MASSDCTECPVCVGNFTSKTKSKITCPKCNYECCKQCVQTYLLSSADDASCMNCNTAWSQEFLFENLNRSFVNGKYKKHKVELLFETEKSRIPETMPLVIRATRANELEDEYRKVNEEIRELEMRKHELKRMIDNLRAGRDETASEKNKERREFIHKCPQDGCNGYLSSQWKCAVCKKYACSKCFAKLGENKEENENHVCNEDDVKTADFVKKDTHACPKCATRIHKISGCSQMWCTQCHVTFDWNTGKIVTGGVIHNPHYYAFLQQGGQVNPVRNPGDQICGGIPNYYTMEGRMGTVRRIIINSLKGLNAQQKQDFYKKVCPDYCKSVGLATTKTSTLSQCEEWLNLLVTRKLRGLAHSDACLQALRRDVRNITNTDKERVKFIMKEIDEKKFKNIISRNIVKRDKMQRTHDILEILVNVGTENFNTIVEKSRMLTNNSTMDDIAKFLTEFNVNFKTIVGVTDYCNNELDKLTHSYNHKPIRINNDMEINRYNF